MNRAAENSALGAVWFDRALFDRPLLQRLLWAYPLLWAAGFLVSDAFWFLPAGVRLTALLVLAPRRWHWLALAEFLTILLLELTWIQPLPQAGAHLLSVLGPWSAYAAVIGLWLRNGHWESGESPQALGGLIAVCAVAATLVSLLLAVASSLAGVLSFDQLPMQLFSYLVGDFVGILVITPLLVQIGDDRAAWRSPLVWRDLGVSVLPLSMLLLGATQWLPQIYIYCSLLLMVPAGWISYRAGWRGAAMAISCVGAVLYLSGRQLGAEFEATYVQLLLAVAGAMSLLSGAWIAYESRLRSEMLTVNQDLAGANKTLLEQSDQLTSLGRRLLRAQESERRRIRSDLRDELSQHLSALNSQLAMLAREVGRPELLARIDVLRTYVQSVRDAADECIDRLQPRAMMSLDLDQALRATLPLTAMQDSGIDHRIQVSGSEQSLSHGDRIAIFRVLQLLSTFTLRLPGATNFNLQIDLGQADTRSHPRNAYLRGAISLRQRVEAASLTGAQEWQSLQDRMIAVGGYCRLEPVNDALLNFSIGLPLSGEDAIDAID
ncbi:MASE1 domain-containing protein [Pseudomarimonas arenosa]|uniref:MASE1 domain-containing protein n=1 Tax=Pseudomarimonas arenosa TaxID=2774145 RepID=A0AAW3ZIV2_9GAMM|nr:MASE1 domain-containing protein [Pseudomarimonas arenosa]MBD8525928.1 MASE1 domain-containing protein [Pseudomarimonas arenosa]